jgi:hypothetical protein
VTVLLVPLALDVSGRLVSPAEARREHTDACPSCGQTIVSKLGERGVRHFAHAAHSRCSLETVLHRTAKLLVVQTIADWRADPGTRPIIIRRCPKCTHERPQRLPDHVTEGLGEYTLANGLRVDVALMRGGTPSAAVEICVTHAVDAAKSDLLPLR